MVGKPTGRPPSCGESLLSRGVSDPDIPERLARIEFRADRLEEGLSTLAGVVRDLTGVVARNTADIAELSADIRRLFDGMSDHLRDHP